MYCSPSSSQVIGIEMIPLPVWNFHSSLPFFASKILT